MAKLLLNTEDGNGMIFEGISFGAEGTAYGEICFNTSMAGYQEIITDPSYAEQVIVMTYPEIGNCGINTFDFESPRVNARGLIIKNYCEKESHYQSSMNLSDYLKKQGIVGISNIDTRHLTTIIRDSGAMNCAITTNEITDEIRNNLKTYAMSKDVALNVSRKQTDVIKNSGIKLAVIDVGAKNSIIENLKNLNCDLTIFPGFTSAKEILKGKFDAVLISNGPGNPQDAMQTIETAKELLGKIPMYGICLGYQILSIVLGAKTYKLKYGHRGGNHPVINLETNKVLITSQNHGYATDASTLPSNAIATYQNLNDSTLEGFKCPEYKVEGVQFHPEAAPGPSDASTILQGWINAIAQNKKPGLKDFMKKLIKA